MPLKMTKKSFVVFPDVFPTAAVALIIVRPLQRRHGNYNSVVAHDCVETIIANICCTHTTLAVMSNYS